MRLYYNNKYTKYLKLADYEEVTLPNIFEIEDCLKDLQDFSKRPKFLNALRNYTKMGCHKIPNSLSALGRAKHAILDFDDITVPKKTADFPKSMLRLLALEKARQGACIKYLKNCYIPVTHVLEYTKDWEKVDEIPSGTVTDRSEYGDLEVSSLQRLKGERAYIQALKRGRMNEVIDLVKDYDQLDDGHNR